ncbi:MAG: hypothetical protein U1E59_11840 [Amaricoccus sp.]
MTILKTPAGSASRATSARMSAESGLVSGGFTTTALPAARAAAVRATANISGWLKGAIRATMPQGSRTVRCRFEVAGIVVIAWAAKIAAILLGRKPSPRKPRTPRQSLVPHGLRPAPQALAS